MTAITLIILGGITAPSYDLLNFTKYFMRLLGLYFFQCHCSQPCLSGWGLSRGWSKKYCDALFLFALYPTNIYSGVLQVVMFTLIPAGVISYLPVELARQFSWLQLFLLVGSSLGFLALAFFVFYSGLKKYESGNRFGTRL